MRISQSNDEQDSAIIAMEVGYQALADLVTFYKEVNSELLKELAILEGKSIKEVRKDIIKSLLREEGEEKELMSRIKASQEIIKRVNKPNK